jgi:beta-glucosidase
VKGIALLFGLLTSASALAAPATQSWNDRTLSPEKRAALLNAELTFDERLLMVHGIMALPFGDIKVPPEAIVAAGYVPGIPRLGIPALYETDASLGVTNPMRLRPGDGATALPSGLALAATFNPDLAFAGGAMIGSEARAKGFNVLLAGGANLARDPRTGRNFEYLGEDPLLTGTMAGASIRGIQSNHIVSTIKHFALNDQETHRHFVNARIDEAALRESDLLAFQLAIEGGHPGAVMCAYNLVGGAYACGNDFLLNQVLKRDWHYPGWVMSDWGAVYSETFAAAGLDQQSGEQLDKQVWFDKPLMRAVERGTIPAARLNDMTGRILRSLFATGVMDHPVDRKQGQEIDPLKNAAVSRAVADEGMVLLQNRDAILPLAKTLKRILIVGGHADAGTLSGGGSSQVFEVGAEPKSIIELGGGAGEMAAWRRMVFQGTAPLAAIRKKLPDAEILFDDGRYPEAAAEKAKTADIVIVFATQWMAEGEDAPSLSLPQGQDMLIDLVARANPKTIVVLETGGAVLMPWLSRTPAVLEAWYGGSRGGEAIADILFGEVNPSGRLPVTFPRSIDQYPRPRTPGTDLADGVRFDADHPEGADVGYRRFAATGGTPLFSFGHGLSYTSFRYSNLRVTGGDTLHVSFDVTNVGDRAGKDAPQVYLTRIGGRAAKRLIGFGKVSLAPGQVQHVAITADPRLLGRFDTRAGGWTVEDANYSVAVAPSAATAALEGEARVKARQLRP